MEYIGVLDSGVGGLSVLKELKSLMPKGNFIFFGDTLNMPYGTKTKEQLLNYTRKILNFFIKNNVKNVVFACNTTSATVYDNLKIEYENKLKIFPLIQSVVSSIVCDLSSDDTVAVLATKATVNSGKYSEEIKKIAPNINVLEIDCTGFVEIVEKRLYNDLSSINLIKEKLEVLKDKKIKKIVLGCTHYPYLTDIFKTIIQDTTYFNPARALALRVKDEVKNDNGNGEIKFFVSKDPIGFKLSGKMFFEIKNNVELVP